MNKRDQNRSKIGQKPWFLGNFSSLCPKFLIEYHWLQLSIRTPDESCFRDLSDQGGFKLCIEIMPFLIENCTKHINTVCKTT